jgi:hypothetical protein
MRPHGARGWGLGFLLLAAPSACRQADGDWVVPRPAAQGSGPRLEITGVIRYSELEGGSYAIEGSDGVTYDPSNLPPEFQKDGLPIEAIARRSEDAAGIRMVGPIIELERIRVRRR